MKTIKYNLIIAFLFLGFLYTSAQKFEKNFTKEISFSKNKTVSLNANYADIEIIEWNKNKIKVDATMVVEGVSEEVANAYFDAWKINLVDGNPVKITSKSKNHFPYFLDINTDFNFDFEPLILEMPEISIESLGVLDSIDFSFPELNFENFDFKFDNPYISLIGIDSLGINEMFFKNLDSINFINLSGKSDYLKKWKEQNQENLDKLIAKSKELAQKYKESHKVRLKSTGKRRQLLENLRKIHEENRNKTNELRKKYRNSRIKERKKMRESREKIRAILIDRDKVKVRTKLTIKVPKGTHFNMNVNYSKISTN
jgi:hypothetical protein